MQIRTGLAIGTGIAIGAIIGMCIDEDTKIKATTALKKKLIFLLTAEEWEPKKKMGTPVRYSNYNKTYEVHKKPEPELLNDHSWEKMLIFDSESKAEKYLATVKDYVSKYGSISILDLNDLRGSCKTTLDFTFSRYGFTEKDIQDAKVKELYTEDDFKIYMVYLTDANKAKYLG